MARVQIYLPDDVAVTLKKQDVNVSRICREALLVASKVCPTCQRPYEGESQPVVELPKPVRRVVRGNKRGERSGAIGGVDRMERMRRAAQG